MSTAVIYAVSGLPEWLDVADRLRAELAWQPVYWITQKSKNHDKVIARFPGVVGHPSQDINRCVAAAGFEDCFRYSLDDGVLKSLFFCESVAMQMMDRMDIEDSFAYRERRRTYHRLLMYWMNIIDRFHPGVVIFNTPPHSIAEFVLYAAAHHRGVRTPIFISTAVNGLLFINESVDGDSTDLQASYRECLRADSSRIISPSGLEYLQGIWSQDSRATPWYIPIAQKQSQRQHQRYEKRMTDSIGAPSVPLLKRLPRSLRRIVDRVLPRYERLRLPDSDHGRRARWKARRDDRRPMPRVFKMSGLPLEESILPRNEYHVYMDRAYKIKLAYKALYESFCVEFSRTDRYLYVPLHYQPERTTCPDGGLYNDQYLMVNLLSQSLPVGWWLYVKEHPTQFSYNGNGEQARSEWFYKDLHALPNVKFIRLESSTLDLIDDAQAVATVTGMAGWEAICRGKPALVFGNAWYRMCRGVYAIASADDCRDALLAIKNGVTVKSRDVEAFVAALEHIAASGYVNPSNAPGVNVSYEDHVHRLTGLLKRFADRISATHTPDVSEIYNVN